MFLIYTKHKTKIRNLGLTSRLHFTSLKLYKRSQIPHSSPRVVSTSSRTVEQKPTTTSLSIYKYSHDRSEEKLSNPWGNKKKSWTHLPSSFLWSIPEPWTIIGIAQLHSTKSELTFCPGWNLTRSMSEIRDGEDLWQWSQLEIRLIAFHRSTIQQKQFINIIIIIIIIIITTCSSRNPWF